MSRPDDSHTPHPVAVPTNANAHQGNWERRWAEANTPWDAGQSAPALIELCQEPESIFAETTSSAAGGTGWSDKRVLVTGCGSGYDVFTFARAGATATGLDLAPSVRARFTALQEQETASAQTRSSLVVADFFASETPELLGHFDLVWDYTFYCAIPQSMRANWKMQMTRLLPAGAYLVMLIFPVAPEADPDVGPPFPLDPEQVSEALRSDFRLLSMRPVPRSHPGRGGKEYLAVFQRI